MIHLTLTDVPSFSLVFKPSVHLISLVRRFVEEFYEKVVNEPDVVSRLAITTHELLENAAKYANDGTTSLYVEVDSKNDAVLVRTTNSANPEHIESLKRWFVELANTSEPFALYADMMRRSAARRSGSGGLGLARIAAEGDMKMELLIDATSVQIVARGRISEG